MEVILKNSEWLRAEPTVSVLFDSGINKKCCLGIFGEQCGIPLKSMSNIPTPKDLYRSYLRYGTEKPDIPELFKKLLLTKAEDMGTFTTNGLVYAAMSINDDPRTTDTEKVEVLNLLFAKHDIQFIYKENE